MPNDVFKRIHASSKSGSNPQEVSKSMAGVASDLNRIQSNIQSAFQSIQQNPFFGGNVLTDLFFTANETKSIAHGLGRIPRYWLILDVISNPPGTALTFVRTSWTKNNIIIVSTAVECTVTLWVN